MFWNQSSASSVSAAISIPVPRICALCMSQSLRGARSRIQLLVFKNLLSVINWP
jgi:hypothetical protein